MTVDALRTQLATITEDLHNSQVFGYECDEEVIEGLRIRYRRFLGLKSYTCSDITEETIDCIIERQTT